MKTAFSRTFSTAATILLLALVLLGTAFRYLVKDYLTETTVSDLEQDASVLADLAASYAIEGSLTNRDFLLNIDIASRISDFDAVICDANGTVVLCSDALTGCPHRGLRVNSDYLDQVLQSGTLTSSGIISGLYDDARYIVSVPILSGDGKVAAGIVIVSTPMTASTKIVTKISNIFLSVAIIVVFVAVLAVSHFARAHSRPLKDMANTATRFGHGDLDARVKIGDAYSEEMEELALAFNNMATALQKSEYQRQEFVANVSHELKTPMTTIAGYIDGILDGTIPPERQEYYLNMVSDETKRLSRLVRSMLDISRLQSEGGIPEEKKMHFDLVECAGRVLITFEQKITAKNLEVDVDFPEHPVYTMADRDSITQVIYNLIDNAVKFCPEGKVLGLKIREGGGKVYISVSNDGETIPPEELPLVFDRFHKTDKSRSQNRDGWGLGLYIVKTIVNSHGENISVASRDGNTTFTFSMPLVN